MNSMHGTYAYGPNLLVVGFAKCATTSLAKHLSHHPEICAPTVKETYFLADAGSPFVEMSEFFEEVGLAENKTARAAEAFRQFTGAYRNEKYLFDATPYHFCQKNALHYAKNRSNTKVIFIIRDPLDRLQSSFDFFKNVQQEFPNITFEEYVDIQLSNKKTRTEFRQKISRPFFKAVFDVDLAMGRYADYILPWIDELGADNIFVGKLEDLKENPQEFINSLCCFLEVSQSAYEDYEFKAYQQTFNVRFPQLQKLMRKLVKSDPMEMNNLVEQPNSVHLIKNRLIRTVADKAYKYIQGSNEAIERTENRSGRLCEYYFESNNKLIQIPKVSLYTL